MKIGKFLVFLRVYRRATDMDEPRGSNLAVDDLLAVGWIDDTSPLPSPPLSVYDHPTLTLLPHQHRLMSCMWTLETHGVHVTNATRFHTQVGVLCDRRSTGKRTTLMSYLDWVPRPMRTTPLPQLSAIPGIGFWETVRPATLSGGNLIIVPHALLLQWVRYTEPFESRTTFVVPDLTKCRGITEETVASYDLVILSCTVVTKFTRRYQNIVWGRVVFDEADSIDVTGCPCIPSCMYWFVSSHVDDLIHPLRWTSESFQNPASGILCNGFVRNTFQHLAYYTRAHPETVHLFLRTKDDVLERSLGTPEVERVDMQTDLHPCQRSMSQLISHVQCVPVEEALYACGIRAMKLETTMQFSRILWEQKTRHARWFDGPMDSLLDHLRTKQHECVTCLESTTTPVCLTCCFNFVCVPCFFRVLEMEGQTVHRPFPWAFRCPYCRTSCPITWLSLVSDTHHIPEWPPVHAQVQSIVRQIKPDERTLLVNTEGWAQLDAWIHEFECRSLDYKTLQGTYVRMQKRLDEFNQGTGCKLLILRGLHTGFTIDCDHVICSNASPKTVAEIRDLCTPPDRKRPLRMTVFHTDSNTDALVSLRAYSDDEFPDSP